MEKEGELYGDGNAYTTQYRMLDVRIGRWFSTDPVVQPWMSPYSAFDNNPIFLVDPLGLKAIGGDGGPGDGEGENAPTLLTTETIEVKGERITPNETKSLYDASLTDAILIAVDWHDRATRFGKGFASGAVDHFVEPVRAMWGLTTDVIWRTEFWNNVANTTVNEIYSYFSDSDAYIQSKKDWAWQQVIDKYNWLATSTDRPAEEVGRVAADVTLIAGEVALTFGANTIARKGATSVARSAMAVEATAAKAGVNLVDDVVIQFGKGQNQIYHAFRHVDALGLNRTLVQSSIEAHFRTVSSQVVAGRPFIQIIEVSGQKLQYTAFKLSDGTFNIGRIHGFK
jgi:RHS repeat-associated protein